MALPKFGCADLAIILHALPELTDLELDRPSQLESLWCFADAAPTLSRSLTRLALYQLDHPGLITLMFVHLRVLSKLAYLCLSYARPGLLYKATKKVLTPPSPWLPRLTRFECEDAV